MADILIPNEVNLLLHELIQWENTEGVDLYGGLFERSDKLFLMNNILLALNKTNPPDLVTDTNNWFLFILDVFIEFASNYGLNNIKSVIKVKDRSDIASASVLLYQSGPLTWPINPMQNEYDWINYQFSPNSPYA